MKKFVTAGVFTLSIVLTGCASDNRTPPPPAATPGVGTSVYDNIFNDPNLSTLLATIDAAGLAATLDNEETPFTVFAPNNDAFRVLEESNPNDTIIDELVADPSRLSSILKYHVVSGTIDAADAAARAPSFLITQNGSTLSLATSGSSPSGLSVSGSDIVVTNSNYSPTSSIGIVHVIRSVLLPPE